MPQNEIERLYERKRDLIRRKAARDPEARRRFIERYAEERLDQEVKRSGASRSVARARLYTQAGEAWLGEHARLLAEESEINKAIEYARLRSFGETSAQAVDVFAGRLMQPARAAGGFASSVGQGAMNMGRGALDLVSWLQSQIHPGTPQPRPPVNPRVTAANRFAGR